MGDEKILVNNLGYAENIKALANRPTICSISYEDLAVDDFYQRLLLSQDIFLGGNDTEAINGLIFYNITYVVVLRDQFLIDVKDNHYATYTFTPDEFQSYIQILSAKPFLQIIQENSYWCVFKVELGNN
jgi:hypothetical protein